MWKLLITVRDHAGSTGGGVAIHCTVVDFASIEDAETAFRIITERKEYRDGFYMNVLRLYR